MLEQSVLEKYIRAGQIAAKVREEIKNRTREGMPIIRICEEAEQMIRKLGGKPAFPCNVSINNIAAHYTSPPGDDKTVPERSVVKIDIGVHVDGYIADTATTVCFAPEYEDMVRTSEIALEAAIKKIRPNMHTSDLGSEIQKIIERRGFKPISNLTGHQVGRYLIHAGKSLPNVFHISFNKIRAGEVYAIEPFVTVRSAAGRVVDAPESYIFRLVKRKSPKNAEAKRLLKYIESRFRTLPFAERWLKNDVSLGDYRAAFLRLLSSKCLMSYPVFVEATGKWVAQSEHTVYVDKNGPVITTQYE